MKITAYHRGPNSGKPLDKGRFLNFCQSRKWILDPEYLTMSWKDKECAHHFSCGVPSTGRKSLCQVALMDNQVSYNWPTGSLAECEFDSPEIALKFWNTFIKLPVTTVEEPIKNPYYVDD